MKDYNSDQEHEQVESHLADEETSEEGFMKGYHDEDEVKECAECGEVIRDEKHIVREIEGETYVFCTVACANDFEESMS